MPVNIVKKLYEIRIVVKFEDLSTESGLNRSGYNHRFSNSGDDISESDKVSLRCSAHGKTIFQLSN